MVEMGSNVLKAKILHSISPKLVQTPDLSVLKRQAPGALSATASEFYGAIS